MLSCCYQWILEKHSPLPGCAGRHGCSNVEACFGGRLRHPESIARSSQVAIATHDSAICCHLAGAAPIGEVDEVSARIIEADPTFSKNCP
jgi:hypothetical protein